MPILAKVQEKCVLNRLLPHISPCLFNMQHGFLKGLSCTTQLLQVFQELGRALDSGLETDVISINLRKLLILWYVLHKNGGKGMQRSS